MHSLMMEHSGKTVTATVMEITRYQHHKATHVLAPTAKVSKIDLVVLMATEMDTQTREMFSLLMLLNGQIPTLMATETTITMTFNS